MKRFLVITGIIAMCAVSVFADDADEKSADAKQPVKSAEKESCFFIPMRA